MSRLVTCMGEVLVDFLPIEEEGRTVGFRMHAGGSPFNVAVGLARLGQPVAFASKISSDLFGRYLREHVEAEGISTRFLLTSQAPSTLAFVAIEEAEAAYAFYDEGAAHTLLAPEEVPTELFDETTILHFGSISLLRGTTPAAVLQAVRRLKGRALLSFDPNLRPGLVRDPVSYRALLDKLFSLADIVKVSAADLAWLAPGQSIEQAAADLLARGPALVAVTQGGEGVLALRRESRIAVPGFSVRVEDTVGAGDAFSAGLLAALAERGVTSRSGLEEMPGEALASALTFGAAVAALTCMRRGADPPRRDQVAQFLEE
ncbi:MAG TPA: carbohydrate kinase [Chloroflexia bacterium]|nr:carbohydrate kinase [Chloroflexia bacterium]